VIQRALCAALSGSSAIGGWAAAAETPMGDSGGTDLFNDGREWCRETVLEIFNS
jgi:hypothetical protein